MFKRILPALLGLALLLAGPILSPALADTTGEGKTVGNVIIYMGLLPAEMIRGHPNQHPEATMHGGMPGGTGEYHLVIALFNARNGQRISNAEVWARVSEVGLAGEEQKLEPMLIAGTETYGNFVRMVGAAQFRISLRIRIPGEADEIKAEFDHRHQ